MDIYDVARIGDNLPSVPKQNSKPTSADVGLKPKTNPPRVNRRA
jgi:hypothetical protein